MNQVMNDNPLDPNLLSKLEALRNVPPRDPEAAGQGQARFMAELDDLFPVEANVGQSRVRHPFLSVWYELKETLTMKTFAYRTTLVTLGMAVFILVFLFGGTGMVASAAQSALPGDALYPVKTGLEQARLSLAEDAKDQAELYLELANRRLGEIESLAQIDRFTEIGALAEQFRVYAERALQATAALAGTNPGQAAELNSQINQSLGRFAQVLDRIADQTPNALDPNSVSPAGAAGNANGAANNANGNDSNGNVSNSNTDDSNTNGGNTNVNGDDNGNSNGDDGNGNSNSNGDDDSNDNGADDNDNSADDNSNGDDNGNDNDNDNGDDNSNGDDDSNDNGADDSNSNGDDNDNGDDSSNGNGSDDAGGDDSRSDNDNGSDDNSGSGGGGDDDSGSGGSGGGDDDNSGSGGDDNSGSGGGDDDNSGSGGDGGDDDKSGSAGAVSPLGSLGGQLFVLIFGAVI